MSERRSTTRVPFRAYVNKVQDGIASVCRAFDLSASGIGLKRVDGPVALSGEVVSVEFQLPTSSEVLVAHGRMTRLEGRKLGVRFTRLTARHRAMIRGYIATAGVPQRVLI